MLINTSVGESDNLYHVIIGLSYMHAYHIHHNKCSNLLLCGHVSVPIVKCTNHLDS